MKPRSKKQAHLYGSHGPERNLFLHEFDHQCAICGARGVGLVHVHEIIGGPSRMRAFVERAAWLPACNVCNCDRLTDRIEWPIAKQLAIKLELDPEWFDLDKICELIAVKGHPNPPRAVTAADVLDELRKLKLEHRSRWRAA